MAEPAVQGKEAESRLMVGGLLRVIRKRFDVM